MIHVLAHRVVAEIKLVRQGAPELYLVTRLIVKSDDQPYRVCDVIGYTGARMLDESQIGEFFSLSMELPDLATAVREFNADLTREEIFGHDESEEDETDDSD